MRKFLLSFFVFAASATYIVYQYTGGSAVTTGSTPQTANPGQIVAASTSPETRTPTPAPTPTPATKTQSQYADGTYTGSPADAYYGMVQIQAVIQGGKLVSVDFLQYPNDRSTSRYINGQAMPLLQNEAIQAQSANVSGVSGATDTSQAFIESLGNALAKARSA